MVCSESDDITNGGGWVQIVLESPTLRQLQTSHSDDAKRAFMEKDDQEAVSITYLPPENSFC